jgi:hypothetical protein
MKNWKTTTGGLAGGIASIAAGVKLLLDGQTEAGTAAIVTGAGIIFALWHAQDK